MSFWKKLFGSPETQTPTTPETNCSAAAARVTAAAHGNPPCGSHAMLRRPPQSQVRVWELGREAIMSNFALKRTRRETSFRFASIPAAHLLSGR